MENKLFVTIRNLEFRFEKTGAFRLYIRSLEHAFRGTLGVYGLSGSGKTTFSKLLAGLLPPTAGAIKYSIKGEETSPRVVYAPQFPERILLGVQIGATVQRMAARHRGGEKILLAVQEYLRFFSLDFEQLGKRNGFELSGGELRRLAIALSLALEPDLLILDEPTVGLDREGKRQLFSILEAFRMRHAVLVVSHDFDVIAKICSHYWILSAGQLIFSGDDESLRSFPHIIEKAGIYSLKRYFESITEGQNPIEKQSA